MDDSEQITSLLKLTLLRINTIGRIETVHTISKAKEILNKEETDLVILSTHLPDGNGIHFLKKIKERFPKMYVIMLCNYSDEVHRLYAKQSGADYFFDKSTEFEQITTVISELHRGTSTKQEGGRMQKHPIFQPSILPAATKAELLKMPITNNYKL